MAPGGLVSVLRLTICRFPWLELPMATLTGLAAARSMGEYCRALSSAAPPWREVIMNRSPAAGRPVSTPPRPCVVSTSDKVTGGTPAPSKANTLPSDRRVSEPASGALKSMVKSDACSRVGSVTDKASVAPDVLLLLGMALPRLMGANRLPPTWPSSVRPRRFCWFMDSLMATAMRPSRLRPSARSLF